MSLYRPCGCGKKAQRRKPGETDAQMKARQHTPRSRHYGNWIYDYSEGGRNGRHVRLNLGTPDRHEADIKVGDMKRDLRQGRDPALCVIKPRLLSEVIAEFIEKHVKVNIKLRSRESYLNRVLAIRDAFDGYVLQSITTKAINDLVAKRGAGATSNRLVAHISKIFTWAKDNGYYGGANPAAAVKRSKESAGRIRYLEATEADTLIDVAADHLKPIITTALYTGGRLTEVLSLKPDDIHLGRGVLYLDQTNTKSGKQREIPIDDRLRPVLEKLLQWRQTDHLFTFKGKPIKRLTTAFETARKRAGLGEDVGFHTLRHTFASWYMINGGDIYRLKKYMGHSDIKLTERYAHLSPDYMKAGVEHFGPPRLQDIYKVTGSRGASKTQVIENKGTGL